jgi:hypothetical protein
VVNLFVSLKTCTANSLVGSITIALGFKLFSFFKVEVEVEVLVVVDVVGVGGLRVNRGIIKLKVFPEPVGAQAKISLFDNMIPQLAICIPVGLPNPKLFQLFSNLSKTDFEVQGIELIEATGEGRSKPVSLIRCLRIKLATSCSSSSFTVAVVAVKSN